MERDRRPFYLWLGFVAANALATAWYWPRLPALIAQHFDGAGRPNGWETKQGFFAFMWILIALMGALWFVMPKLLRLLPFALLNIPHKAYWSAPDRQRVVFDMMERQMNWMGVGVIALQTVVLEMVLATNAGGEPRLDAPTMIAILVVFSAFMIAWLVVFIRRFTPPA